MNEEFAIVFSPGDDAEFSDDEFSADFRERVVRDLADLDDPQRIIVRQGSVGYGADTITVVAVLTGLSALFLSGKSIEENFDAWMRIGTRLQAALKRLRARVGAVSVSEPAAMALALDAVLQADEGVQLSEVSGSHTFPVRNGSLAECIQNDFAHQPDRFYVFLFRTVAGDAYVVGMRSTGQVEFLHRLPTGDWMEIFGVLGVNSGA